LKRGSKGCLLAQANNHTVIKLPAANANALDLTGAGDAFSGAYLANRTLGNTPLESASRAAVAAAMVIECSGAEAALQLDPEEAERRLAAYKQRAVFQERTN
jgi:sugar/nucleoside kinase (ribokinase family)